jgi:predicted amidophosphoribosyltransferase
MSRICSKCKTENLDEANFCKECGTKLGKVCPSCWKKSGQENSCPDTQCGITETLRKGKLKNEL